MSNIIITLPKTVKWGEYQKEIDKVRDGKFEMNFKVNSFPKDCQIGDKCYIVYDGYIRGYMLISGFYEKEFTCDTTSKKWKGKFISRSGEFFEANPLIEYKGFQGWRYYNN